MLYNSQLRNIIKDDPQIKDRYNPGTREDNKNSALENFGNLLKTQQANINASIIPCEVCGKDSNFTCYDCQSVNYCSKEHQQVHWTEGNHKQQCKNIRKGLTDKGSELTKHILEARKNYYENYSNKIFSHCLLDVKLMTGLSKQMLSAEPNKIKLQLDYGASVCLLVKTYKLLQDNITAKYQMQNYLKSHKEFLFDYKRYESLTSAASNPTDELKEELHMKLNLISTIANLCYSIGLNTNDYYILYTQYVIACFGEDSFEASNCYFLLGCFFAEEGFFMKAVACFEKSAKIRGQFGGDCMYNIGILYKMMNNLPKALQTLSVAMKLRQEQHGQDSNQVAEVNELRGSIYTDLNDYKTALSEYEKAFKARSNNKCTPEFYNVIDLIHELYYKLCLYIKLEQPNMKRTDIYINLKQEIESNSDYWKEEHESKRKRQDDEEGLDREERDKLEQFKKNKIIRMEEQARFSWKDSELFHITEEFVSTLNLSELFRLSELQLELERCESSFNLIYTIGTSVFFETLRKEKKEELQKLNQELFKLIQMEDIKKIKHKDK